jgi:hypothetical protein
MKIAIGLLALVLAATSAVALPEPSYYVVPPPEFDHPYDGVLKVTTARDQNHVRELCPKANFSLGVALGCAHVQTGSCWIILAPDAATHFGELVLRHEIAHCNGWPADHCGAGPIDDLLPFAPSRAERPARGGWVSNCK